MAEIGQWEDEPDLGLKKGRFRTLRIGDDSYQVIVDEEFGFIVRFDGVRFCLALIGVSPARTPVSLSLTRTPTFWSKRSRRHPLVKG
jgi:hypothetical protein